jgi:hypothetical protein
MIAKNVFKELTTKKGQERIKEKSNQYRIIHFKQQENHI